MNVAFQKQALKRWLKGQGIEPDLVDLDALIDPTLTYEENKRIVAEYLGMGKSGEIMRGSRRGKALLDSEHERMVMDQARMVHEGRTLMAQELDESLSAPLVDIHDERQVDKWFRNPARYDIPGIDYYEGYSKPRKSRKKAKKKGKGRGWHRERKRHSMASRKGWRRRRMKHG